MTKTVSLKLSDELAEEFKNHQQNHETAQEGIEKLLEAYKKTHEDASDDSALGREGRRVEELLSNAKAVMLSFMTIADDEKEADLKEMAEKTAIAQSVHQLFGITVVPFMERDLFKQSSVMGQPPNLLLCDARFDRRLGK